MTNEESIKDIEENIIPIVGGVSLRMAIEALQESKTGKWKHVHQWTWDCSECVYRVNAKYFKYCPNCGARMEGAGE